MSSRAPKSRLRSTLLARNRRFARLWFGEAVSELGTQMTTIAMPLLALSLTGSPADAGLVGVAQTAASAASIIPAGVLVDRVDRRLLMIACAFGRALALASIPVWLALGQPPVALLVLVAILDAVLFSASYVSERSLLPQVVTAPELPAAVTANEARSAVATLAGPPAGGALFGISRSLPFIADVASFVLALTSLATLSLPAGVKVPEQERGTVVMQARDGFRWLFAQPFLRAGSLLYAAENVTIYAVQLLGVLILHAHGVSSAGIGVAYALVGAGGLLSAVLAGPLRRRIGPRPAVLVEPWSYVLLLPLLLVVHSVAGVGLVVAAMMLPMTLSTSVIIGGRLTLTPEHLRGRVQASGSFIALSLAWIGPLAVGLLSEYAGVSSATLAATGWAAATAVLATSARGLHMAPLQP